MITCTRPCSLGGKNDKESLRKEADFKDLLEEANDG